MQWQPCSCHSFRRSDPEFEEYLRVSALYDQNAGMGRTYAFMHEGRIAGYVVLAAAHVPDTEQKYLNRHVRAGSQAADKPLGHA